MLLDSTNRYAAGTRQVLTIALSTTLNSPAGTYPITFTSNPTRQSVSSDQGQLLATNYEAGNIVLIPTAADVTVSGRVTTPGGQGIRGARVTISDPDGNRRSFVTGSFGVFTFEDVAAGRSYVMSVTAKRYRFSTRVVNVTDSMSDVNFVGLE